MLSMGVCIALAFASCKSNESAYKKAYEKAKQQELATSQQAAVPVETVVVSTTPVQQTTVAPEVGVRQEKVTVVSGDNLKDYSVVCGSFGLKANAEALKEYLIGQGYSALIAFNAEAAMYRVIVGTYPDKGSAIIARDAFKNKYPSRKDFQESWLLYRLY